MNNLYIFNLIIIIATLGFFVLYSYIYNEKQGEDKILESNQPPIFLWEFEEADSLNLDGIPQTNIFLKATYSNGAVERKLIKTSDSSCNELPDNEEGSVPGSASIQCYGAGLGYRLKVTKGAESYLVLQKKFEEASPEYNPPMHQYEIILEFPY